MNGLNPRHLLDLAIVPALQHLGLDSKPARALVLGTAIVESDLRHLRQIGAGPALGLWQCEPRTHGDIYNHYLVYNSHLDGLMRSLSVSPDSIEDNELCWNLRYAAGICRLHYRRVKAPLPTDARGMAYYWKDHYNTIYGAGDPGRAAVDFEKAIVLVG